MPIEITDTVVALLTALSRADIEALPPVQRRRLADQCRRAAALAEPAQRRPTAGVLAAPHRRHPEARMTPETAPPRPPSFTTRQVPMTPPSWRDGIDGSIVAGVVLDPVGRAAHGRPDPAQRVLVIPAQMRGRAESTP